MNIEKQEITEIINRETLAWDTQDLDMLISIFHRDMVWPWPKNSKSHDPINWVLEMGRFDDKRWRHNWQILFDSHKLEHNRREIKKIEISNEKDGAIAIVDIDTLWINKISGERNHWIGRTSKVYTKLVGEWKLIMHTGVLDY